MHVEVHPDCVVGVSVVTLRHKDKNVGKFWIAIQSADALNNVAVEDLKDLACDHNLSTNEPRATG